LPDFLQIKKGSLIIADPSYGYWTETAEKWDLKITVPLTIDKKIDVEAMYKAIPLPDTKLIPYMQSK
jgi:histidinol-phosphate/aromatic aminotransferase/cobyric acid decarboxylase-like protein